MIDEASAPDIEYVNTSPSASVAVTVPIDVWFSAALNVEPDVIVGASLMLVTETVIPCDVEFVPSLTLIVAV